MSIRGNVIDVANLADSNLPCLTICPSLNNLKIVMEEPSVPHGVGGRCKLPPFSQYAFSQYVQKSPDSPKLISKTASPFILASDSLLCRYISILCYFPSRAKAFFTSDTLFVRYQSWLKPTTLPRPRKAPSRGMQPEQFICVTVISNYI